MASADDASSDMRGIVREEVLSSLRAAGTLSKGWMVAVLDKSATRVISSVVTMFDIMEERVTLVESLEKKRQPFPEMDVVYFMAPTRESIGRLVDDFKKKANYGNVHIFFLSKVDSDEMRQLQSCPALIPRIKTFKEINVDFLSAESAVFHFDMAPADVYSQLYSDEGLPSFAKVVARKLLTMCASLHECPLIRTRADSPMESVAIHLVVSSTTAAPTKTRTVGARSVPRGKALCVAC